MIWWFKDYLLSLPSKSVFYEERYWIENVFYRKQIYPKTVLSKEHIRQSIGIWKNYLNAMMLTFGLSDFYIEF